MESLVVDAELVIMELHVPGCRQYMRIRDTSVIIVKAECSVCIPHVCILASLLSDGYYKQFFP